MRRLGIIIYAVLLGIGLYFAYRWNSPRLPQRVRLPLLNVGDVVKMVIYRNDLEITLQTTKNGDFWIFQVGKDVSHSYSIDNAIIKDILESICSAKYAYLVEPIGVQSLHHYGLGLQEHYEIEFWMNNSSVSTVYILGALAPNGYDIFLLRDNDIYRASFLGLYERIAALERIIGGVMLQAEEVFIS